MNILLLIAPTFAGVMRVIQGDYIFAFAVLGVFNLFGGVLFLMARRPSTPASEQPCGAPANATGNAGSSDS